MYTNACMFILGERSVKGAFGTNRKISKFKVSRDDLIIILLLMLMIIYKQIHSQK